MKKLTPAAIGALTLAATLALALPAQADKKMTQAEFAADCLDGDNFVEVKAGKELEVENKSGDNDFIGTSCTVYLGDDSELQLGEDTYLSFEGDFTICSGNPDDGCVDGDGEIELQIKKNSLIEADNFIIELIGEEASAQIEESFCLLYQ